MPEADLMTAVLELLRAHGFLAYHTYDSRQSEGGFPDVAAIGNGRCLFIEVKRHSGKLTPGRIGRSRWQPGQDEWKEVLGQCSGVEYYLVTPMDWLEERFQQAVGADCV
jgi:hypothetical protein